MRHLVLIAATVAGVVLPFPLRAQANADEPISCAQAASAAQTPTARVSQRQAVAHLSACTTEFGEVMPRLWRQRGLPDSIFAEVRQTSLWVNDRRTFAAALIASEDPGQPVDRRLAALEVMAHYVDSRTGIGLGDLQRPPAEYVPRATTHSGMRPGVEPAGPGEADQALQAFQRLSLSGAPAEVQRAARYARQVFALQRPKDTPLQPGVISGTWDCKGDLRLRSTADIKLLLGIADSTGAPFMGAEIWPPDAVIPSGYPTHQRPGEFFQRISKRGSLTVSFGDRTLLTLPCH
jgi:hypothetical protein